MSKEKRYYETVFIIRPDLAESQVEALGTKYTDLIREKGGEVTKTEYCGLRSLAYRINKNRKGYYVLMNLECPSEAVAEMERQMRISEDVMRYLTVKVDELDPNPSMLVQQQGFRDSREDFKRQREDFRR